MTVEPMAAAHIAALAELEQLCFSEPWSADALRQELTNPCARFFAALCGGVPVGYIGCLVAAGEGDITNVAVHPEFRRRGIAGQLIDRLTEEARREGVTQIHLEVRASNTAAMALYEGRGFCPVGRRPRFYRRPTEDAVLYTLIIKGE